MEHSQMILGIMQRRDISAYKLAKETGISESLFSKWKKKPTSEIASANLIRIADYLDCSVDYLLGRTETVNPPIPKDEGISDQIVNACRKLNEAGQERVALYAEDLVSSGRYQKAETLPLVARGGETIEISEPVDAEAIKKADEEHPPVYPPEL